MQDNDSDGQIDNCEVMQKLNEEKPALKMIFVDQDQKNTWKANGMDGQTAGSFLTLENAFRKGGVTIMEETWHMLSDRGYDPLYPDVWGRT